MKKLFPFLSVFLGACAGEPPNNIGVNNGRLTPCPDSPNCVTSYASDEQHGIEPLSASIDEIRTLLGTMENVNVVRAESDYLYAEFTTPLMGFVDDVEFYVEPGSTVTQVRSASRLGHSDLGANRKRIEGLRSALR